MSIGKFNLYIYLHADFVNINNRRKDTIICSVVGNSFCCSTKGYERYHRLTE